MSAAIATNAIPEGFVLVPEFDTFIGHVGGLHWKKLEDRTETLLVVQKHHTNPIGTAHGGLLMTLLDITLGATAQQYIQHRGGGHPATIQLSCSLIAGAKLGDTLMGEARVDTATKTLSFVTGRLHVSGKTIITGTAVFRNPPPTEPKLPL